MLTRLEPVVYEMLTLSRSSNSPHARTNSMKTAIRRAIQRLGPLESPEFLGKYVQTLCLVGFITNEDIVDFFRVCTGVKNLAIRVKGPVHPLFPIIRGLRPLRLSISILELFNTLAEINFDHPFFSKITHLRIMDKDVRILVALCRFRKYFPSLTHLAIVVEVSTPQTRILVSELARITLAIYSNLQVFLGLYVGIPPPPYTSCDPRFLLMEEPEFISDWEAFMSGQSDMWTDAEDIILANHDRVSAQRNWVSHFCGFDTRYV